ncbi:MAG: M48 family metallopeptidase [Patescibacteria group bacterium]|jgi:heat shock protein HtpX
MYTEIAANKRKSVILMMIFIVIIIGLSYVFSMAQGDTTYAGVWFAIIFSFFSTSISYFQGDKIALWTSGARPISEEENKYVYRLVENLCIASGAPIPKIYIIDDPAINAFATGRKPELASIAITTGAIQKLENEELEGVIAHELSHIQNYDIRFMTLVAVLVGAISIMAQIFLRSRFWGSRRRSDSEGGGQIMAIFMIVGIVLAILSPVIAEMIKLAISRRREYLADASGSLLTRFPEGLANALEKIKQDNLPMQKASQATAHLFLASPFSGKNWANAFSTHPPLDERIKKLREMTV